MNRQQKVFAINWLQLDIDMAQNAKALVELLDDIHRGNNYINIVLLVIPLHLRSHILRNIVRN